MNKKIYAVLTLAMALPMVGAGGQMYADNLKGKVIGTDGKPVADVAITSPGCKIARTAEDGTFSFDGVAKDGIVTFRHDGFYTKTEYIKQENLTDGITVHLVSDKTPRYNEYNVMHDGTTENSYTAVRSHNVTRKDFTLGSTTVENAMRDLQGVEVIGKSGMTGEGAYIQLRGVKSLVGANNPLYVINGVPYMPDQNESLVINGYSRSVFEALNGQDIKNITVLTGGATAIYGSLGSNGVILIETDQASKENMSTKISFNAMYGFNWSNQRIPLMNSSQYKGYITDLGQTYSSTPEKFFSEFSFLKDLTANNANLYTFDTDWQDQIMRNSTTKDLLFRVEGGDAIAKYNISLGYTGDDGTVANTNTDSYHAQINASVLVSRKLEILASVNTAYMTGQYMEQGMSYETNPLLTAYRRAPILSPHASDMYGQLISKWSTYQYGAIDNEELYVSNPSAVVNTIDAKQKQYDLNAKVQLVYRPTSYLTINGLVGLYYNYNHEQVFIPGQTDNCIKYLFDEYGKAENTVRVGTDYTFNLSYGANATFAKVFQRRHDLKVQLGFQGVSNSYEYDASYGRNTGNDFYREMAKVQELGQHFDGYNDKWHWANGYLRADYVFDGLLKVGGTLSLDGYSNAGKTVTPYYGLDGMMMLKRGLKGCDFINKLNVYASVAKTGNSRFSTKYSHSYYTSTPYAQVAGIIRANLATTTKLKAERDLTVNEGIEAAMWNNRLMCGIEYYQVAASDVIVPGTTSSILGTSTYYANAAEIESQGIEAHFSVIPVIYKGFSWTIGANINTLHNKVVTMGDYGSITYTLTDGATMITRSGCEPFSFYGYQTNGVYSTTAEANSAYTAEDGTKRALVNANEVSYQAGDVRFVDQNGDGVIDSQDRVVLGSATPKAFGSLFTRFDYKGFALDMTFGYQWGGQAYNAMRRITESSLDFSNQSTAVLRRWSMEGQITDMPKAEYGDPRGNNAFSDRWIEKTDFFKLRNITLSYTHSKPLWNFLQSATIYVTGENLFTITDYLGLDPEFSYSYSSMLQGVDYGKVCAPRSVKMGVNLKF